MDKILNAIGLPPQPGHSRGERIAVSLYFSALAVAVTALVIYGAYFGLITALILRALFFSLVASAGLAAIGFTRQRVWARAIFSCIPQVACRLR